MRVRDGAVTTVTDSLSLNHSPVWSPDSHWLYFISNSRWPERHLWRSGDESGKGGGPRRATQHRTWRAHHALSRDGTRLAYSRYSSRSSLWSMPMPANPPVSSAGATRVTNANEFIESLDSFGRRQMALL